jgi:hypothetical protein
VLVKTPTVLLLACCALAAPMTLANAEPREADAQEEQASQREEQALENPVADPYTPPSGDPDPFAGEQIPGESTSPLNPAED